MLGFSVILTIWVVGVSSCAMNYSKITNVFIDFHVKISQMKNEITQDLISGLKTLVLYAAIVVGVVGVLAIIYKFWKFQNSKKDQKQRCSKPGFNEQEIREIIENYKV